MKQNGQRQRGAAFPSWRHRRRRAGLVIVAAVAYLTLPVTPVQAAVATIRVTGNSTLTGSESAKDATATCPSGRTLVGAGANINNGGGHVVIDQIVPKVVYSDSGYVDQTSVKAWALEDQSGTAANWTLSVYAICTNLPVAWYQVRSATDTMTSDGAGSATASCPGLGQDVLGAGYDIVNGDGHVKLYEVVPDLGDDSVRVRATEEDDGYSGIWSLKAYVICGVLEGAQFELEDLSAPQPTDTDADDVTVSCGPGYTLFSAGLEIWSQSQWNNQGFDGRLTVDEIRPDGSTTATPTSATIWVLKDPSWSGPWWDDWSWKVTGYAICVDPS